MKQPCYGTERSAALQDTWASHITLQQRHHFCIIGTGIVMVPLALNKVSAMFELSHRATHCDMTATCFRGELLEEAN
jgi:hypothetical protein